MTGIFRYTWRSFSRELTFLAAAIVFAVPAYVLLTLSFKTTLEAYSAPMKFPTHISLGNYKTAWQTAGVAGLGHAMVGSAIITVSTVVCIIVIGSICGYAIARRPSRLTGILYLLFVLGIVLPVQLAVIPLYVVFHHLGLLRTYPGIILLEVGLFMPFGVFMYAGFIRALPKEYEEAAQVDGAGLLLVWRRVVMPLLLPVTGTVAVLVALFTWNDFFDQLIYLYGGHIDTAPLAIYGFSGSNVSEWNLIMAAIAISLIPALAFYVFAQKQLIRGFAGGLKG